MSMQTFPFGVSGKPVSYTHLDVYKRQMNVLGWEAGSCRLPLVEPSDAHKEKIEQALEAEGLIQE